ncbi:MAG: aldehyde dehydrogenase family protein [Deltaproteobacteria bacterium]|nr:aldehyde dehydrogenase family protein [Deltaproteobacteria bacterium]
MMRSIGRTPRGDLIDGKWLLSGAESGEIVRSDPGDAREPPRRYPTFIHHVDLAVGFARRAVVGWNRRPEQERIRFLARLRDELSRRKHDLAVAISGDMGKPIWESNQEIESMLAKIDLVVDDGLADLAMRRPVGVDGGYYYRPLGVVAVIGPFNFPARLPHGQAITALVAGNAVVMKASELAPATGELYAEIMVAAGIPPGVFQLIQGGPDVGAALSSHPDLAAVMFTGSYQTGLRIQRATLEQPGKLLVLEMGGKNATIVLADADIDQAAHDVASAAFITTGQRCTATSRLVVDRKVAPKLLERVVALAQRVPIGYAFDDGVFMGPLVSEPLKKRFLSVVSQAERDPAVESLLPTGSAEASRPGSYVRPSIHRVLRRDPSSAYQRDELFGPDLAVYEVDGLEEAIAAANDCDYGLAMSVYTRSEEAWAKVLDTASVGLLGWNRPTIGSSSRMPFAGLRRSGNHRDGGVHLMRSVVHPVATIERRPLFQPELLPPHFPRL